MGDRVLIVVHNESEKSKGGFSLNNKQETEYSPAIYGHWGGGSIPNVVQRLKILMDGRGQVDYTAARLIGIMHSDNVENLSLGVSNLDEEMKLPAARQMLEDLGPEITKRNLSYGDRGVVWIDCVTWEVTIMEDSYELSDWDGTGCTVRVLGKNSEQLREEHYEATEVAGAF